MLLVNNARLVGKDSYPETVKAALGKPGYILVTISLLAYTFGSKLIPPRCHLMRKKTSSSLV